MENIDETQETEDAHPLVLSYFKRYRGVLEAFSEHDVSAPAQRFYLYLCHNSLVHHGISHKLDIVEIANYFSKTPRRVYSWIGELEDAALMKVRSHGSVVAELHFLRLAQNSAKAPVSDLLFHKSIVKGGEVSRAVPVNSDGRGAICVLMDYQLLRFGEVSGDRWLFSSRLACGNKPLHRQTAHNALKRAFIAAGLNGKLATHSLRKSFAQRLYDATDDIYVVQEMLGHKNVTTTQGYLMISSILGLALVALIFCPSFLLRMGV